ncbi:hypothetical protein KQH21_03695 [Streptomyces sp. IpFD-1.1]|uniref:hypothetical protein n=1 Tax=Streptomyces albidoflavus TaxID=1886 RepID=UPI000A1C7CB0|nr:hypothetical protein [Streptomyces albidoflavus]MBV7251916.1 hypothetical protein [Streptomyces sp. S-2]MCO6747271.1 hypothetical protein [Streptomyces sp. IpFD-1.1]RZE85702.1 hypothetical protein C0R02_03620 [Streptomyces albidoflavus]
MNADRPLPSELKAVDSATLLRLQQRARDLGLSQRLDATWVRANAQPDGTHHLWTAFWHELSHRQDIPRQLRCELLIALGTGVRVRSLLDVLPADFTPLPRVTAREEGLRVARLADRAPSVREWLLRQGDGEGEGAEAAP